MRDPENQAVVYQDNGVFTKRFDLLTQAYRTLSNCATKIGESVVRWASWR